ncbi:C-22 sterol desaturase [Ceratobasidium sp. AG-Ba]|nr:C-22 sterol desaturase [Ceratobasidium sp. AG-Ba]
MDSSVNEVTLHSDVFTNPNTGRGLRIYLDTTHIKDHVFTTLRNVIESGGGCITSNKDDGSIWIVDPEAPYALDEWKDESTVVLFAPWLLACAAHGSLLGADEGNWCGFKVVPKVRPKIVIKQGQKKKAKLHMDRWPTHLKNAALRVPLHSIPPVEAIPLDAAPVVPLPEEWGIPRADGKRPMSTQERMWIAEVIEWCMTEYPGMNVSAMCEMMAMLVGPFFMVTALFERVHFLQGWHRKKEGYQIWITRNMVEVAGRSPHFMDLLLKVQSENEAELVEDIQIPTPASSQTSKASHPQSQSQTPKSTPAPKPPKAPKPGWYYEGVESSEADDNSWTSSRTPFTDEDRMDFIRYAAARPNGMEAGPGENTADVWKAFVEKHPSHSHQSWRTWHQHRRAELKTEVARYRTSHML